MLLKNCKKIIIINAGHHLKDSGAVSNGMVERDEVMKIRDLTIPKLKEQGFNVVSIPDNLDLRESIKMVNLNAKELYDGIALDIHFNHRGVLATNQRVGGTEVYSGTSILSRQMSGVISENIAKELGVPNRGYRPHTWAGCGSLGWITNTKCWSFVVECLYMDDTLDRMVLSNNGREKIAIGIVKAMCSLYDIPYVDYSKDIVEPIIKEKLSIINQLMAVVMGLLQKLIKLKSDQENRFLGGIYKLIK